MTRMTPNAEELVKAGRDAFRPSEADRERVLQALLPRLGGALGAASTQAPSIAPAAAKGTLLKVAAVVAGLGVAGGGLFLALRSEPPPAKPAATAPVKSAVVPPAPVAPAPESAPPAEPEVQSPEKRAPVASSRPADSLAEEVAILSRASAELHAGRPAAALLALEEHRRRFPRGVLAQERTSARVQALCALGRTKQAQAELTQLARSSPNSPHVARAKKACGSEK